MSNVVKASEYAAFCSLYINRMKADFDKYGKIDGYYNEKYIDWNNIVSDATRQFTSYYEDDTLIEQDVPLDEALRMAGLL